MGKVKLYTDYMGVHFAMSGRSFFAWPFDAVKWDAYGFYVDRMYPRRWNVGGRESLLIGSKVNVVFENDGYVELYMTEEDKEIYKEKGSFYASAHVVGDSKVKFRVDARDIEDVYHFELFSGSGIVRVIRVDRVKII